MSKLASTDLAVIERPLSGSGTRAPGILAYAERPDVVDNRFDRFGQRAVAPLAAPLAGLRGLGGRAFAARTRRLEADLCALDDAALRARAVAAGIAVRRAGGMRGAAGDEVFAALREVSRRALGLSPFDVQLMGARALTRGLIAQMRTGEGKTLTAALAAAAASLAGWPVHVITTSDYLAERDAREMGPLFDFLGLPVGVLLHGQDLAERRAAYAAPVVYGSNKEFAFDYLRDRMELRRRPGNLQRKLDRLLGGGAGAGLRMRGLHFAIVDEADSVMIDEARTPLIIAGEGETERDGPLWRAAFALAARLERGRDFRVLEALQRVELGDAGKARLEDIVEEEGEATLAVAVIREHAVTQALAAEHLFHRDRHYLVRDDKVVIVDEHTGRVMPDRTWSEGLHQMVELKEGLEPSAPHRTLARMTYQRFFRRYLHLCGMTGTATDSAWEFWAVYGLGVARIPTNRPDARIERRPRAFRREDAKWEAIADEIARLAAEGRPVLVGVRSVARSERVSALLDARGVPHQVLSAAQDADEAGKIARAGEPGRVTVATNMAGRGVDIRLPPGVAERGGLHVILSERHDSRRVDRQLAGRCGRQGDPGVVSHYVSLEDDVFAGRDGRTVRALGALALALGGGGVVLDALARARQRRVEMRHAMLRRDLLEADSSLRDLLAVSGMPE